MDLDFKIGDILAEMVHLPRYYVEEYKWTTLVERPPIIFVFN